MAISRPRRSQSCKDKISSVESCPQEQGLLGSAGSCVPTGLLVPALASFTPCKCQCHSRHEGSLLYLNCILRVRQVCHPRRASKVVVTPVNFLTCVLTQFLQKSSKNQFHLSFEWPFSSGRSIFSFEEQFATFLFFFYISTGAAVLASREVFSSDTKTEFAEHGAP